MSRGNVIAGKERIDTGRSIFDRRDPADERRLLVRHSLANAADVDEATAAARNALPEWAEMQSPRRAEILHRTASLLEAQADEAANEIATHAGKTIADARAEVARTATLFRFFAEQARSSDGEIGDAEETGTTIFTRREPLGVVALITPWNFPLAIPARKLAPALAFGNTVLLKPSPLAAVPALRLAGLLAAAGLPAGCLNVLVGDADVGEAIANHERVNALSFTGSTKAGRTLIDRLASKIPVQAEMGGHNPVVVLGDADPRTAAELIARGAFSAAGQTCTATRRAIVEERIYEAVRHELIERTKTLRLGPGMSPQTEVPPLIASERRDTVERELEHALQQGATLAHGGTRPSGDLAHGAYLTPAILDRVQQNTDIAQQEVFGPVVSLISATDFDDAVEIANNTAFGLSAAIVTNDLHKAMEFVTSASSGMVHVNRPTVGSDPQMPFGGTRASSHGLPEQGKAASLFYTHTKTVYLHV